MTLYSIVLAQITGRDDRYFIMLFLYDGLLSNGYAYYFVLVNNIYTLTTSCLLAIT